MRLIVLASLLHLQLNLHAQKISKCIEVLDIDSMRFHFASSGVLTNEDCADYFRIVKLNRYGYFFDGKSQDYYSSGQLAVDCAYKKNLLHGKYTSYYKNGQVKETGNFSEGRKNGEWRYWHDNGKLKKVIVFKNDDYYLQEFYLPNGKQTIVNGNGKYKDKNLPINIKMQGQIKNGKQHGKWIIYNHLSNLKIGVELFNDGKFIEGKSIGQIQSFNNKYDDYPNSFIDFTEDLLFESYSNKIPCFENGTIFQPARYNSKTSDLPFYDLLYQNFNPAKVNSGYIILGFTILPEGKISDIKIHSTLPDKEIEKQLLIAINSSEDWYPAIRNNKPVESTKLFILQFDANGYTILGDSRNNHLAVDQAAKFNKGMGSFIRMIESAITPPHFLNAESNLGVAVSFYIDENGNYGFDDSVFKNRITIKDEEQKLYSILIETIKSVEGKWNPAILSGRPVKHYFNGIFNITDGKSSFRLISNTKEINNN